MTEIAMKQIVLCYEVHSTCIFRMLRQLQCGETKSSADFESRIAQ